MAAGNKTFLEQIKANRVFADGTLSNSDNNDHSSDTTSTDSMVQTREVYKAEVHRPSTAEIRNRSASNMQPEIYKLSGSGTKSGSNEDSKEESDLVSCNKEKAQTKVSSARDNAKLDIQACNTELPCNLFFVNEKTSLQRFETYDELSEYLLNVKVTGNDEIDAQNDLIREFINIPLNHAVHYITMGEYMRYLYEHNHLMDVHVNIGGKIFSAHRVALCCNSDYFADRFGGEDECQNIPIELTIKGISADAFAVFLKFCYTGEISVYPEIADEILIAAVCLKVRALKGKCDVIARNLPLDKSLKVLIRSKEHTSVRLYMTVFNRVLEEFMAASVLEPFLQMDVDLFCRIIQSDKLVVVSEFEVFTTAIRWIVHDMEHRVKHTVRILTLIRFYYMTHLELFMCAETTSLVRGYDRFREMVLIANWMLAAENLKREDPFHFPVPKPRHCYVKLTDQSPATERKTSLTTPIGVNLVMPPPLMTSSPKVKFSLPKTEQIQPENVDILVVGGFAANDCTAEQLVIHMDGITTRARYAERYDVEDNQWLHFSALPSPRRHHAVIVLNQHLYLIGGSEPYDKEMLPIPINTIYRMDIQAKKWSQIANMNVHRYSHCACVANELIFVIGGKGKHDRVLLSVECYDPQTEGWFFIQSLPQPVCAANAATLGNRILVVGGIGASKDVPSTLHVLDTVYCYNTLTSSWTGMHNLRFPRCHSALVNICDRLFVCGGATRSYDIKNSVLCSVSAIDEYQPTGDEWLHVADMVIPRHDAGVAVAGSRIYVIGGVTTGDRVLRSIECYDTKTSDWVSGVQDLPYPARWICCCSVPSKRKHS